MFGYGTYGAATFGQAPSGGEAFAGSVLAAIGADLIVSATRYTPTSAVLNTNTNLIVNALRLSAGSGSFPVGANLIVATTQQLATAAVLSVQANLIAASIQRMAGIATPPIEANLLATAIQRMAAAAVLAGNLNVLANATRFTPTSLVMAASASVIASSTLSLAGRGTLTADALLAANGIVIKSLDQIHFRFRDDLDAVDATPTWIANEDANISRGGPDPFRIRVAVMNRGPADYTGQFALYASFNGGPYALVTTTSQFLKATDASSSPDETQVLVPRLSW